MLFRSHLNLPTGKKTAEGAHGLLSHGLSQTFQQKPNQTIKPNAEGHGGSGPAPSAWAAQISMRLARRRQRGASGGMALRLISFPSRRSTCSLEKFMTSTTVQKLLMENSVGTRGAGVGRRSPDQGPGSAVRPDSLCEASNVRGGTRLGGAGDRKSTRLNSSH